MLEGNGVGRGVGFFEGNGVGEGVGFFEGDGVGGRVGLLEGNGVGIGVGLLEGGGVSGDGAGACTPSGDTPPSSSPKWQHMMWRVMSSFPIPVMPHSGASPWYRSYISQVFSGPTEIQALTALPLVMGAHDPFGSLCITPPNGTSRSAMGQYASYGHMLPPFYFVQNSLASSYVCPIHPLSLS